MGDGDGRRVVEVVSGRRCGWSGVCEGTWMGGMVMVDGEWMEGGWLCVGWWMGNEG